MGYSGRIAVVLSGLTMALVQCSLGLSDAKLMTSGLQFTDMCTDRG